MDEFTTEDHEDMLSNEKAEAYSSYQAYQSLVGYMGVKQALDFMGLEEPPAKPL